MPKLQLIIIIILKTTVWCCRESKHEAIQHTTAAASVNKMNVHCAGDVPVASGFPYLLLRKQATGLIARVTT